MLTGPEAPSLLRSRSVVSREIAGETLVVPVRGKVGDLASIYSFNVTGSFIWQRLDSPTTLPDLISAVQSEFEVDAQQARQDVTHFLNEMSSAGLIEVCPMTQIDALEQIQRLEIENAGSV